MVGLLSVGAVGAMGSAQRGGVDAPVRVRAVERIRIAAPMVIAFAPIATEADAAAVMEISVALNDFEFHLADVRRWASDANIPLQVVRGKRVQLVQGSSDVTDPALASADFGLVLVQPDATPLVLEGAQTGAEVRDAACAYFANLTAAVKACGQR